MRAWVLLVSMVASPLLAQDYDEAAANETLAACLAEADEVQACIGAVRAACELQLPEDDREYVALSCGEAAFGAWYERMQREAETAFRHVEAFEKKLFESGTNPEYLVLYRYLSQSQQGWEAYARTQCAIAPLAATLQGEDGPENFSCEVEKYADRIVELRHMVRGLN